MIEIVNALACLVLMALVWRVALVVDRLRHRLVTIGLTLVLGMQVIDPVARWLPAVLWTTVAVNVTLAVVAMAWRRELWALVRSKLQLDGAAPHMRRSSDFAPLGEPEAAPAPQTSYGGTT